jgi:N utilization substance protein B
VLPVATAVAEALALFQRHAALVDYGVAVVRGVIANLGAIDRVIRSIAPEWPVAQMAPVDRNLLRIALWEIGSQAVPVRVAINEAVELARRYSGESARRMVNGALGSFAKRQDKLDLEPYRDSGALDDDLLADQESDGLE